MNFLEKLNYQMEKQSMNRATLSKVSGVPYTTIDGFYKKGYENTKVSTLRKIAAALNVSIDYLIEDDSRSTNDSGKNTPAISDGAMQIAKDYDGLDRWGQQTVRSVVSYEMERCEYEREFYDKFEGPEEEEKVVNLFDEGAAAGLALGLVGQGSRPYVLGPDDPRGASYAIRVSGDSMEPDFPDGSIAFVNHDEMRDGDIGVFCLDGATLIKQWHYDSMMGITYLFSLNRKRADADQVITANSGRSLVWQGRVITKKRYRVPGM